MSKLRSLARRTSRWILRHRKSAWLPAPVKGVLVALSNTPFYPGYIQMEPTRRCNLRCVMCALTQFYHDDKTADMTLDDFKRIVSQLPKSTEMVTIQGTGEPLLNKDLIPMIQFAREQGLRTTFNTNLLRLTDEMAEQLVAAQNYEVVVSIETTNPERYADIRRNGAIECFIENLERLNRAKQRAGSTLPKITACCVLMKHTLDDIPDLIAMLKKHGVVKVHTADMCTYPEYAGPLTLADGSDLRDQALSATMTEDEIWAALAKIKALGDESIEIAIPGDRGGLKIEHADDGVVYTCLDLWRLPFIKANSEMATCCWAPQFVMGNFKTQTFDEIWFGKAYRKMRLSHLTNRAPEHCRKCQQRFNAVAVPSTLFKKTDPRFPTDDVFL